MDSLLLEDGVSFLIGEDGYNTFSIELTLGILLERGVDFLLAENGSILLIEAPFTVHVPPFGKYGHVFYRTGFGPHGHLVDGEWLPLTAGSNYRARRVRK